MAFFVGVELSARYILGVLLDYLSIAVIISIIYFFFQLVTGGDGLKGIGDWFSGGGKEKSPVNPKKQKKDVPGGDSSEIEKAKEKNKENGVPVDGSDFNRVGGLVVVVKEENSGTPLNGVEVTIQSKGYNKKREKDPYYIRMNGSTDVNGLWPEGGKPAQIGAGVVTVRVAKKGWYNVTRWFGGTYQEELDWPIAEGKVTTVAIALRKGSEKPDFFEPKIMNAKVEDGNLIMEGKISEGT